MDHSVRRRPSPPVALPRPVPKLGPFEIDRKSEPFDVYNDVGSPHPFAAKPLILAALNCGINDGSSFCGAQVFRVRRELGVSERRACRVLKQPRTTQRYRSMCDQPNGNRCGVLLVRYHTGYTVSALERNRGLGWAGLKDVEPLLDVAHDRGVDRRR